MAEQEKPKVIFDDKEYEVDSLSAEAKYLVDLLGSLQSKERNALIKEKANKMIKKCSYIIKTCDDIIKNKKNCGYANDYLTREL